MIFFYLCNFFNQIKFICTRLLPTILQAMDRAPLMGDSLRSADISISKASTFLIVASQIGMYISNSLFGVLSSASLTSEQTDLISYLVMIPLIFAPLVAGYLLQRQFPGRILFLALLLILLGQILLIVAAIIQSRFILIVVGRMIFITGFSMASPSLVTTFSIWDRPNVLPIYLTILFIVEIFSQSAGSLLYGLVFNGTNIPLWISQAVALSLCFFSFTLVAFWYKKDDQVLDRSESNISQFFQDLRRVINILVSTSVTIACIYTFQVSNVSYLGDTTERKLGAYIGTIIGGFSALGLLIFWKTVIELRQRMLLLLAEKLLTIFGFCILYFEISLVSYITAIAMLGLAQAALYLTFFTILISSRELKFRSIIIGLFYALINLASLALSNSVKVINSNQSETDDENFENLTLLMMATTFLLGLLLGLFSYFQNRKARVRDDHSSEGVPGRDSTLTLA